MGLLRVLTLPGFGALNTQPEQHSGSLSLRHAPRIPRMHRPPIFILFIPLWAPLAPVRESQNTQRSSFPISRLIKRPWSLSTRRRCFHHLPHTLSPAHGQISPLLPNTFILHPSRLPFALWQLFLTFPRTCCYILYIGHFHKHQT